MDEKGLKNNFLIIMSDQHNSKFLGNNGGYPVKTPNLDKLAKQGVTFNSTYCGNPLCVPSRMSFLTGRDCSDIKVWSNKCRLNSNIPTFAHHMSNGGYETVLCGRMHFEGEDQHHGFEKRLLGDVSGALDTKDDDEDFHIFENVIPTVTRGQNADTVKAAAGPGRSTYQAYDTAVTDRFKKYLKEKETSGDDRPFCTVIGYLSPHCPYISPKEYYDEYVGKIKLPRLPDDYVHNLHPAIKNWMAESRALDITQKEALTALTAYYGLVTFLDMEVGRVMDALNESTYKENTVVVYVSDHGEMAGEHGMWWKSTLYEGAAAVPMIWSFPGKFHEGKTIDNVTSLLDVGPTLLDLAGGEAMNNVRGRSLRRFLEANDNGLEKDDIWVDEAFSEEYGHISGTPARMYRKGPWKLIYFHGYDTHQLFNLKEDPEEFVNLYENGEYRAIRDELFEKVKEGWLPEEIRPEMEKNHNGFDIIDKFNMKYSDSEGAKKKISELWKVPGNVNVFPEK